MNADGTLRTMRTELEQELRQRILPYWIEHSIDERHGGFVGLVLPGNVVSDDAPKGAVLNARILWTFAAADRTFRDRTYRELADRAQSYIRAQFVDPVYGGVYWMVNSDGSPRDDRKHVYAQAFAIYALAEHYRATAAEGSVQLAIDLFHLTERCAADAVHGGYTEAFSREWVALDDVRLSDEDANETKSVNTHLHLLEAYTALHRVWPDPNLQQKLSELVAVFLHHIIDSSTGHVHSFFDADWTPRSSVISYGHDIETSWLLLEAVDALGDEALRAHVTPACITMAGGVREQALDADGGVIYRTCAGGEETHKEWWVQAEAMVGFVNAYQQTGRREFLDAALQTWAFVKRYILDREDGEWRRRVDRDGSPQKDFEKIGPWKCPYHNSRACLEVIARVDDRAVPH